MPRIHIASTALNTTEQEFAQWLAEEDIAYRQREARAQAAAKAAARVPFPRIKDCLRRQVAARTASFKD